MIKKTFFVVTPVLLALGSFVQLGDRESVDATAFMRAKLKQSQKVLEGLVTNSYDTIAENASSLSTLSHDTDWNVIQTAECRRHSDEFRRHTRALIEAAQKKNVAIATLAYIQLTLNCMECHKHVRQIRQQAIKNHPPQSNTGV